MFHVLDDLGGYEVLHGLVAVRRKEAKVRGFDQRPDLVHGQLTGHDDLPLEPARRPDSLQLVVEIAATDDRESKPGDLRSPTRESGDQLAQTREHVLPADEKEQYLTLPDAEPRPGARAGLRVSVDPANADRNHRESIRRRTHARGVPRQAMAHDDDPVGVAHREALDESRDPAHRKRLGVRVERVHDVIDERASGGAAGRER